MPFNDPEKQKVYCKTYAKTENGMKSIKINGWKQKGIISIDWDKTYLLFRETKRCQNVKCNVELTTDSKTTITTKCLDHNHLIKNVPNIRAILCHSCNCINKINNKSGVSCIRWDEERKRWVYGKTVKGKQHQRRFKYFIEAVIYKMKYELKNNLP